jgi:hypothetical protein
MPAPSRKRPIAPGQPSRPPAVLRNSIRQAFMPSVWPLRVQHQPK